MTDAGTELVALDDRFIGMLAEQLAFVRKCNNVQGFYYAGHHVIRDVAKPWAEQELWRKYGEGEQYEAVHAEAMRQIEIEELRKAIARVMVDLRADDRRRAATAAV